ncbi:MAG: D-alanyl-D-alanine carboxypeptidase family protein, partial [Pseudomonadota bacterium]
MIHLPQFIFTFLIMALCLSSSAFATPTVVPKAPIIASKSYIMIDYDSGKILAEKNSDKRVSPASITKVMTAFVVFSELGAGNIKLDDLVTISKKAWKTQGSRMFIEVNRKVSVEDLLQGMIIQSGNDASVALAEYVAGSEDAFAALMNQHASSLGMTKTNFLNSTGLPNEAHLTTAKDLSILARELIKRFPQYYKWYSTKEFTFNKIKQHNRNQLLWRDKTVDGMKTGYTKSAGYCLLASSKRGNMRIITVVLGTESVSARTQESQKLLNFGFRFYETHALYKINTALKQVKVYKGGQSNLDVGLAETLYVTIPRGQYKNLKPSINISEKIMAPITKGQQLGEVV